jgi:cytochrome c peroxidase
MQPRARRATQIAAIGLSLACSQALMAQRQHQLGLTGDLPLDTSNWPHPAAPDGNPWPRSTAPIAVRKLATSIAQLGKLLFWDEQVSSNNTVACGTCHLPRVGGTDDRPGAFFLEAGNPDHGNFGAFGVIRQSFNGGTGRVDYGFVVAPSTNIDRLVTPVTPPTMIGAFMFDRLFWDRRAGPGFSVVNGGIPVFPNFTDWAALEDLAVEPPMSPVEMGHENISWATGFLQAKIGTSFPLALVNLATVPADVLPMVTSGLDYNNLFNNLFAAHPQFGGLVGVTRERVALALANYHRTLVPDQAPIDLGTMNTDAVDGFNFLKTNASCFFCHSKTTNPTLTLPGGRLADPFDNVFSDGLFHQINVTPTSPQRKTPTLRNVALHKKFFSTGHGGDGTAKVFVTTFDQMLTFYDNQPGFFGINGTGPGGTMTPKERFKVTQFFLSLTDPRVAAETFPFDRPQLRSEVVPFETNEYGNGTAGASGLVADIIANVPEKVVAGGAVQWFKIGTGKGPAGRPAFLLFSNAIGTGPVLWVSAAFTSVAAPNTNAQGISTAHVPFPLNAAAIGLPFYTQWMFDDGGVRGFSDAALFVPY